MQIDFSQHFVDAAVEMQTKGTKPFTIMKQGLIEISCNAEVPFDIDRTKIRFEQGNACALGAHLGAYFKLFVSSVFSHLHLHMNQLKELHKFIFITFCCFISLFNVLLPS